VEVEIGVGRLKVESWEYELPCRGALCSVFYRDFGGEYREMCKKKTVCPHRERKGWHKSQRYI
jgi:hypothetical protein